MSLCMLEGFESYGTASGASLITELSQKWATSYMSADWATLVDGPSFGKALRWENDETYGGLITPIKVATTIVIGFAAKPGSGVSYYNEALIRLMSGTNYAGQLVLTSDGHLNYYRGASSLLGTTSETLPMGTWTYVELKVYIDNSLGTVDIHFNGQSVLALSNVDTLFSTTGISEVQFHPIKYFSLDDIYIYDDIGGAPSMQGPIVIEQLLPTGDDTHNWTPSTGSTGYEVVDNPEIEDTTYISDSTVNTVELWSYENLSEIDGTILAAQQHTRAGTDDVGLRTVEILCESGGTTDSVSVGLTTDGSFDVSEVIYENDPNTSSAWTISNLNAANFGVKVGD